MTLWNTAAARMWRRPEGDVLGKKLATLGLHGLPGDLLVEKTAAVREGKTDHRSAVATLDGPDGQHSIDIEVLPIHDPASEMVAALRRARRDRIEAARAGD